MNRLKRVIFAGFILLLSGFLLSACSTTPRKAAAGAQVRSVPKVLHGQYVVRRGDTLYSIARRHGWDWKALAAHNRIGSPYTLTIGQIIRFDNRPLYRPRTPLPAKTPARTNPPRTNPPRTTTTGKTPTPPAKPKTQPPKPNPPAQPTRKSAQLTAIKWQWPTDGTVISRFAGNNGLNKGIDIAGKSGQPVRAAADGLVTYAGNGVYGNGEALVIKHGSSLVVSVYGNNRRLLVNRNGRHRYRPRQTAF